jgi:hypothetical protein
MYLFVQSLAAVVPANASFWILGRAHAGSSDLTDVSVTDCRVKCRPAASVGCAVRNRC